MTLRAWLTASMVLLLAFSAAAKNGAFKETRHGDRTRGPQRRLDQPRGSCVQCHDGHVVHVAAGEANPSALFTKNDNELCFRCHESASDSGLFPGSLLWAQSAHGRLDAAAIPGDDRDATAQSLPCLFCHDPHGVRDVRGVIPGLARMRGAELCTRCHDGARASNVRDQLTRAFVHGGSAQGAHATTEGDDPARFAATPANQRHVDCGDCHNVHASAIETNNASSLIGVSRVEVDPASSATAIRFTWRAAGDRTPVREYEVCFKCHSSWTKQPARQADIAQLTLPRNPSFHPIQESGKNRGISRDAFVSGYSAESRITCGDCHGSDEPDEKGLHGSRYEHLLRRHAGEASGFETASEDDLCFACHAFEVYASGDAPMTRRAASRFNEPAGAGHIFHVVRQQIPCAGCHDPHGSTRYPALLVRASGRGLTNYTQTASGGSCQSTCHEPRSYAGNYAR